MASARPAWAAGGSSASLLSVSGDLIAETSTLSVSEEVSAGLSALNSLSQADASALLDAVWAALTASTAGGAGFIIPALSTRLADSEPAKLAGAAVATLLLEAARLGAPEEAVRFVLCARPRCRLLFEFTTTL